jgi:hypothetical protein
VADELDEACFHVSLAQKIAKGADTEDRKERGTKGRRQEGHLIQIGFFSCAWFVQNSGQKERIHTEIAKEQMTVEGHRFKST